MANAFTAGVEPGGLRSMEEIKTLVCYLLHSVKEPVAREMILEIIAGNGMANFFDTGAAIEDLIKRGHIAESGSGMLGITATGSEIAEVLDVSLPYVLRERSVKIALQLLTRMRRQRDAHVEINETDHGHMVTLQLKDGERTMMEVTVAAADSLQAAAIKQNFLNDPTFLYRTTIAVLNGQIDEDGRGLRVLL